jgi:CheY-like chemotaxis protein
MLKKKLNCILLIDDDPDDNFFHQVIIKQMNIVDRIDVANDGVEALEYLRSETTPPELIFLDINMPRMNGWEFLAEYKQLYAEQKAKAIVIFLTTSANPEDLKRARQIEEVSGFETKPLSAESLTEILQEHFPGHV